MAKVFTGFVATGGIVVTPFLLLNNGKANSKEVNAQKPLKEKERGIFHLERGFKGCEKLLEDKTRQKDFEQIYLCPLVDSEKFELIYYNKEATGGGKISKKIKSLSQFAGEDYSPKLRIELEDLNVKTIEWPKSLFDFVSSSSREITTLDPEKDCKLTLSETPKLFECNENWIPVKLKTK